MTHTTLPDEILKTDLMGRVRTPKARREALLEEFERSGVSGTKFAALVGVNYQTFASWVQQRRKERGGILRRRRRRCCVWSRRWWRREAMGRARWRRGRFCGWSCPAGPGLRSAVGGSRFDKLKALSGAEGVALAAALLRALAPREGSPC